MAASRKTRCSLCKGRYDIKTEVHICAQMRPLDISPRTTVENMLKSVTGKNNEQEGKTSGSDNRADQPRSKSEEGKRTAHDETGRSQESTRNAEKAPQGTRKQRALARTEIEWKILCAKRFLSKPKGKRIVSGIREKHPTWATRQWSGEANPCSVYSKEYMRWEEERGWPHHAEHERSLYPNPNRKKPSEFDQPSFSAPSLILNGDIDKISEAGVDGDIFPEGTMRRLLKLWDDDNS